MYLILSIARYQNLPPEQAQSVCLGAGGGTIGRSADNDLVLPDPDRWVSGHHAKVRFHNGAFLLSDSSTNGTVINHASEPLTRGREIELHDGDELSIGAYDIRISLQSQQSQPESPLDPFSPAGTPDVEPMGGMSPVRPAPDILELVDGDKAEPESDVSVIPLEEPSANGFDDWSTPAESERGDRPLEHKPAPMETGAPAADPDQTPDENAFFRPPHAVPKATTCWRTRNQMFGLISSDPSLSNRRRVSWCPKPVSERRNQRRSRPHRNRPVRQVGCRCIRRSEPQAELLHLHRSFQLSSWSVQMLLRPL